jgi:putative spermidine/putrescine transport system substrate-binding protein
LAAEASWRLSARSQLRCDTDLRLDRQMDTKYMGGKNSMKSRMWHLLIIGLLLVCLVLSACGAEQPAATQAPPAAEKPASSEPASAAAPASSSESAAAADDFLNMSMAQIEAAAKKEGQLVFYSWWAEEYWKDAASKFKEKYGIDVKVVIGDNTVDKLLAEKDKAQGTIDVQEVGGSGVKLSVDGGIWYGPVLPKMEWADKLDPKLSKTVEGVETKGYLVPIYRNQTGFLYDPDKVKTPPQTWDELVKFINDNPKQFAYCDPNKGGTGQAMELIVISNLAGGLDKYTGDTEMVQAKVADWDKVWAWFKENNPKMNLTASNNESLDLLNQGAASLILAWDDDTQIALNKGTLFKRAVMYIPTMGLPGGGDAMGVLKNAPHKAAGLLWLNFLTSKDMQIIMNKTIGSYPARIDITDIQQLIPEEQRQKYGLAWYPAAYKQFAIEEFTKKVLMK